MNCGLRKTALADVLGEEGKEQKLGQYSSRAGALLDDAAYALPAGADRGMTVRF